MLASLRQAPRWRKLLRLAKVSPSVSGISSVVSEVLPIFSMAKKKDNIAVAFYNTLAVNKVSR